jgi:hypothetical protein
MFVTLKFRHNATQSKTNLRISPLPRCLVGGGIQAGEAAGGRAREKNLLLLPRLLLLLQPPDTARDAADVETGLASGREPIFNHCI